jgi:hypothetical protein
MLNNLHVFGNGDAGAFLAAVLQGIEAEIRQGRRFRMIVNSKNPAGFTGFFVET